MPLSGIPKINLNADGTIDLTVEVYGFEPGTPIEISGQASQASGAFANFYDLREVPPEDSEGRAVLTVNIVPSEELNAGEAITVFVRAAQVWATILEPAPEIEAAWNAELVVSPLAGPPPGPPTGPVPPWWPKQDGKPEEGGGPTIPKRRDEKQ